METLRTNVVLFAVAAIFVTAASLCVHGQSCTKIDAEVLILGAGTAGISAAKTLQENGKTNFLILEQVREY